MSDDTILLKDISNKIDDYLHEIHGQYELKNVDWEIGVNDERDQIEITLEDFGTGGCINTKICKEDVFCAAMIVNKDKHHVFYNAVGGLLTATLLNNLAIAGIESLTKFCSETDLKFFLGRFKRKEE